MNQFAQERLPQVPAAPLPLLSRESRSLAGREEGRGGVAGLRGVPGGTGRALGAGCRTVGASPAGCPARRLLWTYGENPACTQPSGWCVSLLRSQGGNLPVTTSRTAAGKRLGGAHVRSAVWLRLWPHCPSVSPSVLACSISQRCGTCVSWASRPTEVHLEWLSAEGRRGASSVGSRPGGTPRAA